MTAQAGSAPPSPIDRDAIRRAMRRRRAALTADERDTAAHQIARRLGQLAFFRPGARIGVYSAVKGEIDLAPFIALARRRYCRLYLPRILNTRLARMEFVPFGRTSRLRPNAYGIGEIHGAARAISPRRLDLILLPVLAFDAQGWRLGMGAGYYDRYLSWLRRDDAWRRPRTIGVAYDFQRVPTLSPRPWDVRLDAVVTESGVFGAPPARA